MKENKEKAVTSGEEDIQVLDDAAPLNVQKPIVQARKRKSISSSMDLSDVPTHRGPKKQKTGKTPPPKVPKFPSATVHLDASTMNLVPVQTIPTTIQTKDLPLPANKAPYWIHPSEKASVLPIWCWTRVMPEGHSKGSSLTMR